VYTWETSSFIGRLRNGSEVGWKIIGGSLLSGKSITTKLNNTANIVQSDVTIRIED